VLDVLQELLAEGRNDAVVELFTQLVLRNWDLEILVAKMRESKNRGERVSASQRELFLDKLREQAQDELAQANHALEQTAPQREELLGCAGPKPISHSNRQVRYWASIRCLMNHRVALTRFLDDGRLPIDNGNVERLHRRPAVGRRYFLFAGSHAGAERAAVAYSVLGTCTLLQINPSDYLADVLPKLARGRFTRADIAALAPAAWKKSRAATMPAS
jgi:hypothetical protein